MKIKHVAILILVVLGAILLLQNSQVVTIKLFLWEVSMSRIIMFPLLMLVGFILGFLMCSLGRRRR